MKCPICGNEFDEHTGRRPKKFCSDVCKIKFWNIKKTIKENNKPENKKRILEQRFTINEASTKWKEIRDYAHKPEMPKGLSLAEQIQWKIDHK